MQTRALMHTSAGFLEGALRFLSEVGALGVDWTGNLELYYSGNGCVCRFVWLSNASVNVAAKRKGLK